MLFIMKIKEHFFILKSVQYQYCDTHFEGAGNMSYYRLYIQIINLKKTIEWNFRYESILDFIKYIMVMSYQWPYYLYIKLFTCWKGQGCRIVEYLFILFINNFLIQEYFYIYIVDILVQVVHFRKYKIADVNSTKKMFLTMKFLLIFFYL